MVKLQEALQQSANLNDEMRCIINKILFRPSWTFIHFIRTKKKSKNSTAQWKVRAHYRIMSIFWKILRGTWGDIQSWFNSIALSPPLFLLLSYSCVNFLQAISFVIWRLNVWIKRRFPPSHHIMQEQMSIGIMYADFLHSNNANNRRNKIERYI